MKIAVVNILFLVVIAVLGVLAKSDMISEVFAGIALEILKIALYSCIFLVIIDLYYFLKKIFKKEEKK